MNLVMGDFQCVKCFAWFADEVDWKKHLWKCYKVFLLAAKESMKILYNYYPSYALTIKT